MTTIFLLVLFVIQIIGFYFLALLYTKISKFDNLEKKQQKLMGEMDDSLAAYLSELKDENDRLINKLNFTKGNKQEEQQSQEGTGKIIDLSNQPEEKSPIIGVKKPVVPVNVALKSYGTAKLHIAQPEEEPDDRTRALRLHDAGESIEEIAKTLGKGRTEVELILKFR